MNLYALLVLVPLVAIAVLVNLEARERDKREAEEDRYLTPAQRAERERDEFDRRQW